MALITIPSAPAFRTSDFGISRSSVISESGFTGSQQVQRYPRAQWFTNVTLPPMKRALASKWQSFFMKLEGRANTFLMGDTDAKEIRGTTTSLSLLSGASIGATSVSLNLSGQTKTLLEGDYIQFETGSDSRLHMVTADKTGDGSVSIEPPLKAPLTTGSSVSIFNARGVFRMDSNDLSWSADEISTYGITFSCKEAI